MSVISNRLLELKNKINNDNVRIIAVTKYVGIDEIISAYKSEIRDFAESKVQDAQKKRSELPEEIEKNVIWHFIGHLQTNKVKYVVGNFEYIHSVNSLKLARNISDEALIKNIKQKILIQVNVSKEKTKYGFGVDEVKEVFKDLLSLKAIEIQGLMTMAEYVREENKIRSTFRELREIRNYLQSEYQYSLPELSMGMSNDYQIAVQEGSTMIRIGQALFK